MCGRFYIDEELESELEEAIQAAYKQARLEKEQRLGEVFPTQSALVIASLKDRYSVKSLSWGYVWKGQKKPIINARRETILQKPLFCDDFINRRCIVPARGFYEWNPHKEKYYFKEKDGKILYMAGIYTKNPEECKFTILTTSANDSVRPYHDRMPVLIEKEETNAWLNDFDKAKEIIYRTPKELEAFRKEEKQKEEYEQIHIFNTFNL